MIFKLICINITADCRVCTCTMTMSCPQHFVCMNRIRYKYLRYRPVCSPQKLRYILATYHPPQKMNPFLGAKGQKCSGTPSGYKDKVHTSTPDISMNQSHHDSEDM